MQNLRMKPDWLDNLLPEGLPVPSSTMISGPGGSGKPLIANIIAAAWLREGGSVVFMPLQYPDQQFLAAGLSRIAHLDLDEYQNNVAFIEFNASLQGMTQKNDFHYQANVAIPEVWDKTLERACAALPGEGPGILIFATALNLLLFSPTYGKEILERMKTMLQQSTQHSSLITTSTSAKAKEISELEAVADNLMMVHQKSGSHELLLKIERMKQGSFHKEEVVTPISAEVLSEIKKIADLSRKRVIPQVRKL